MLYSIATRIGATLPRLARPPVYDCLKCPGYCCSYPVVALDKRDVERLAALPGAKTPSS